MSSIQRKFMTDCWVPPISGLSLFRPILRSLVTEPLQFQNDRYSPRGSVKFLRTKTLRDPLYPVSIHVYFVSLTHIRMLTRRFIVVNDI